MCSSESRSVVRPKNPKTKKPFLGSINRCSWCRVAQGPILASYVPPLPNANLASTSVLGTTPKVVASEDMSQLFGFYGSGKGPESAVVWWSVFPPVTRKTGAQFPAAEAMPPSPSSLPPSLRPAPSRGSGGRGGARCFWEEGARRWGPIFLGSAVV